MPPHKNSYDEKAGGKKFGKKKLGRRERDSHIDEYLDEVQIKEGLDKGILFEGVFRVNQNNRKRAFVSVNDFVVDVMIDDLMS